MRHIPNPHFHLSDQLRSKILESLKNCGSRQPQALKERNHEVATDEKTKIEDMQREEASKRQAQNIDWKPKLFRPVRGGPNGPEEGEEALDWILNATM